MDYNDIATLVDIETREQVIDKAATRAKNNDILVEVGCFLGGSICRLASKIRDRKNKVGNVEIYAVDNWGFENISPQSKEWANVKDLPYFNQFSDNIKHCGLEKLIIPITGDSIEVSEQFTDGTISFLFLDGEHNYPYVLNEIKAWLPKMKKGGLLAGHDYCSCEGIRNAVKEVFGDNFKLTTNEASYFVEIK